MTLSSSKRLGIILDERNRRTRAVVLQALAVGRQSGLRAGYQAIDQLAEELALTRAELERVRERYAMAREIIRRADAIDALREREHATMH
jgi:hypothetical protein